jgi:mannosyltransferase
VTVILRPVPRSRGYPGTYEPQEHGSLGTTMPPMRPGDSSARASAPATRPGAPAAGAEETAAAGADDTAVAGANETAVAGADETAVAGSNETAVAGANETAVAGADETPACAAGPAGAGGEIRRRRAGLRWGWRWGVGGGWRRRWGWGLAVEVAVVLALGLAVWLRFWASSALWLDEALTVDIARAPLHAIPGLLRDDGAPPLYYYLLHFWMDVFGQSNLATRSLAGLLGVVNIPVAWLTGYRVGARGWAEEKQEDLASTEREARHERGRTTAWAVALLVATSPFVIYYDTEARMYGMVILLGTLAVLAYTSLLRHPSLWTALGLAVVMSAAVYSHYWALYSLAVAAVGSAWCVWKGPYKRACRYALGALVAAGVSFLPWLPTFWFQIHHTGTPWAAPARLTLVGYNTGAVPHSVTSAVVYTVTQFAGGSSDPGRSLGVLFLVLAVLAIFASPVDQWRMSVDLRTRPGIRVLALAATATLLLGLLAGRISGTAFADRYTAMIVFPALVCMAYGLTAIGDRRVRNGVVAVAVILGLWSAIPNADFSRTGAGEVGKAIAAQARPGDVVAYCPDQLGPAVSRVLGGRFKEITFPRGSAPEIVNWVNYLQVVRNADPVAFTVRIEAMAGRTGTVWYVWSPGYVGYSDKCEEIAKDLRLWPGHRSTVIANTLKPDTSIEIYEGEILDRVRPA